MKIKVLQSDGGSEFKPFARLCKEVGLCLGILTLTLQSKTVELKGITDRLLKWG